VRCPSTPPPPFQTRMASEFDCVLVAAAHVGASSRWGDVGICAAARCSDAHARANSCQAARPCTNRVCMTAGPGAAGYAALGPYARSQGWAPGPVADWQDGAAGWILWISLAIMLGDSLTSLSLLVGTSVASALSSRRAPGLHAACACNSCARSCANL